MTDNNAIANLADAAADKIDEVGWRQNYYWESVEDTYQGGTVCAIGSLYAVTGLDVHTWHPVIHGVKSALCEYLGIPHIPNWNDDKGTTQQDVTSALRDVATKYRSDEFRSAS